MLSLRYPSALLAVLDEVGRLHPARDRMPAVEEEDGDEISLSLAAMDGSARHSVLLSG